MNSFIRKLKWLMGRSGKEAELQEELRFHLEEEMDERAAAGLDESPTPLAARRSLGNLGRVAEDTRAAWGWPWVEQFFQDVGYALRTLAANRTFSALAILSLALGIGANTAIYSFIDSILLRPLPVPHPEAIVSLSWRTNQAEFHGTNRHDDSFLDRNSGFGGSILSNAAFEMFRKNSSVFSTVFGFQGAGGLHVAMGDQAEICETEYVTEEYFGGLGVAAAAGRTFAAEDDRADAPAVAVIGYALSQRHFGNAAAALGQRFRINNQLFTVIGVAPPEFSGADPGVVPEVYVPMHARLILEGSPYESIAASFTDPNYEWIIGMGRLRAGVTRGQAQSILSPQFSEWMRSVNTARTRSDLPRLVVRDGSAGLNGVRQQYSKPLFILLVVVALILMLACVNIANLLLARGTARRREIAVRLSIGAGRARIVRQLLTESITLASLGGILGIAFALWGIRFVTGMLANGRDNFTLHAELNWHVLGVMVGLSILTGILFGLAPALQSTRADLLTGLKQARAGNTRRSRLARPSLGSALMVAQIAISGLILVAAGLFVHTLARLERIPLGFARENVLTFQLDASRAGHPEQEIPGFYSNLRARFAAIPGVRSATLSDLPLMAGKIFSPVTIAGGQPFSVFIWPVGPDYFSTMQIPVLLGRQIEAEDMNRSHLGVVVSQDFARQYFAGKNPLGQFLSLPEDCPKCSVQIVGVSAGVLIGRDVRDERGPTVFLPFTTWSHVAGTTFELRTAAEPLTYVRKVRALVHEADPRLPISDIRTQSAVVDEAINREVMFARLCTGFALLALTIACVGLYGALSYDVARRTSEIGIRMALGASRGRIHWTVLRDVLLLCGAGLAVGIPAALYATRLIQAFLFETEPNDPLLLGVAAGTLLTTALLAGLLPARNASRIDPIVALRHE